MPVSKMNNYSCNLVSDEASLQSNGIISRYMENHTEDELAELEMAQMIEDHDLYDESQYADDGLLSIALDTLHTEEF